MILKLISMLLLQLMMVPTFKLNKTNFVNIKINFDVTSVMMVFTLKIKDKLYVFSKGFGRYLALCLTLLVQAFLFFGNVARRRTSSYGVVRPVLIAPLHCWRNSTPFLCKASICTVKIDHFRARAIDHSILFSLLYSSK